jgi:hypothetical protein
VAGTKKKLLDKIHDLYPLPNIRAIKSSTFRYVGQKRNECRALVGKPEGKRLLPVNRR